MSPLVIIVTGLFCLFLTLILSYSQIHGATMLISYTPYITCVEGELRLVIVMYHDLIAFFVLC